jgi:hypothetical protein
MNDSGETGWELAEKVQTRGNFAYTISRAFPRRGKGGRAPLGIAAFISIPLFFCSLMASTLAQEKAHKIQWHGCHSGVCTIWHDPTTANVARVWLWALVPSLVLVIVGFIASRLPLGFYVSCIASIVIAMGVAHDTATWARHHTQRFPQGVDLIPDHIQAYAFSNHFNRGEWEKEALSTSLSLQHWTIGIALAAMLVMGFLWARSRFKAARRPGVVGVPAEGVHAPDITSPGL